MYTCICYKVTEQTVKQLLQQAGDPVERIEQLQTQIEICNRCRKCAPFIEEMLEVQRDLQQEDLDDTDSAR